jgi:hypothetical protein
MNLQFDEIEVTFNENYVNNGSFFMQNNNGTNEFFMLGNLKVVVDAPIIVSFKLHETRFLVFTIDFLVVPQGQFQLYHKNEKNDYVLTLPTFALELCALVHNYRSLPLSTEFVRNLRRSGHIPTKCPVKLVNN